MPNSKLGFRSIHKYAKYLDSTCFSLGIKSLETNIRAKTKPRPVTNLLDILSLYIKTEVRGRRGSLRITVKLGLHKIHDYTRQTFDLLPFTNENLRNQTGGMWNNSDRKFHSNLNSLFVYNHMAF